MFKLHHLKRILLSLVFIFVLAVTFITVRNTSISTRFSDEVGHWVGGSILLRKGVIPYKDITFNHQPLSYLFGTGIDSVFRPQTLYNYITRMRIGTYIYFAFWMLLLVIFFREKGLLIVLLFEAVKASNIGFSLLGETIAVYPFIFICCVITEYMQTKKISTLQVIIVSICFFLSAFSLLPLWPALLVAGFFLAISFRKDAFRLFLFITPALLCTVVLFLIIPFADWYRETIYYNSRYFLSILPAEYGIWNIPNTLLLPFRSFFEVKNPTALVVSVLLLTSSISLYVFFKKNRLGLIILVLILALSNNRITHFTPGNFHLIPWIGAIISISVMTLTQTIHVSKAKGIKNILTGSLAVLTIFSLINFVTTYWPYMKKTDLLTDYYIKYSASESYGKLIKSLAGPGDTLLVYPNDPLVYLVSTVPMRGHVLEYYDWILAIPEYKKEIEDIQNGINPPTFIFDSDLRSSIRNNPFFSSLVKNRYIQLSHLHKPASLYVLKSKVLEITDSDWKKAEEMLFTR